MADQIDYQYAYPDATALALEKHNRLTRAGAFRQQVGADVNFVMVGLRTGVALNATQRRQLETAIAGITGVQAAKVLIFGVSPAAADVPADHHIDAVGELRFRIEPNS